MCPIRILVMMCSIFLGNSCEKVQRSIFCLPSFSFVEDRCWCHSSSHLFSIKICKPARENISMFTRKEEVIALFITRLASSLSSMLECSGILKILILWWLFWRMYIQFRICKLIPKRLYTFLILLIALREPKKIVVYLI